MADASTAELVQEEKQTPTPPPTPWWNGRRSRLLAAVLAILVVVGAFGWYEIDRHWPYRHRNVLPLLESVFASHITIDRYSRTYFPHPGFVAQGITMRRNTAPDLPPVASAKELRVEGSWADLLMLRERVVLVEVKGIHVVIPPPGSKANQEDFPPGASSDFTGPETAVGMMHLIDGTLDLMQDSGGRLRYPIHDLKLYGLHQGEAVRYDVDMDNAAPAGHIVASGSFGPVMPKNLGLTPLSGHYTFTNVDLGRISEMHGILAAEGEFSGVLGEVRASGKESTPDFSVKKGRPARLDGEVQCRINGLNGDVALDHIVLRTNRTTVEATGGVQGSPKVTELDVTVDRGYAQDLLGPFMHRRPPIAGLVWLKSHAHMDPAIGDAGFLDRLKMTGRFSVPQEKMTNPDTAKGLTAFSERAQGGHETSDDVPSEADVLSALNGDVTVRKGIMQAKRLTFDMPGVKAELGGTYGLESEEAHLTGTMAMQADLSHAVTGWKSVLLKPLAPFFKKKKAGAVVPIAVTGRPGSYKVESNVLHDK